jgi:hypothetical protein
VQMLLLAPSTDRSHVSLDGTPSVWRRISACLVNQILGFTPPTIV